MSEHGVAAALIPFILLSYQEVNEKLSMQRSLARILIDHSFSAPASSLEAPMQPFSFYGDSVSVKPCDRNIERTIQLTEEMIRLANTGDEEREDTGCGILYGVVRDAAYKIRKLAETEQDRHKRKERRDQDCFQRI